MEGEAFYEERGATTACAACGFTPMRLIEGRYFLIAAVEPDEHGQVPAHGSDPDPEGLSLEALACTRCGYVRLHGFGFVE